MDNSMDKEKFLLSLVYAIQELETPLNSEEKEQLQDVSEQLSERISAELALQEVISEYKYNPLPLKVLVDKLANQEDRCLCLKLAYMVIKASPNNSGELIDFEEKKAYRQLVDLLNLDEDLVEEIELQASKDLEKFQHPLQAFLASLKEALDMY